MITTEKGKRDGKSTNHSAQQCPRNANQTGAAVRTVPDIAGRSASLLRLFGAATSEGGACGLGESPFNTTNSQGRRSGYAYEYQQKIAAYTNWKYEYVEGSWPELLKAGKIDLMSDVSYTDERSSEMLFSSSPMGAESYYVFISSNNTTIKSGNYATLQGKRVGVNKGSFQEQLFREWSEKLGIQTEIVELVSSEQESVERLQQGEFDSYITLDAYGDLASYAPVFKIGQSEFFFAVNNSRHDLLTELDTAMSKIQEENRLFNQQLYDKYLRTVGTGSFLTSDDLGWLSRHGPIRVGYLDHYLPFCDTDPKTGKLVGALSDYLETATYSRRNVKTTYSAAPYPTISAAMDALKAGEIDCVFPVCLSPCDEEQMGISVTKSLMESELYAAVRKSDAELPLSKDEVTVVVDEGNANYESFLNDTYPSWARTYCSGMEDGFQAVQSGAADCMLFSNYRLGQTEALQNQYSLTHIPTGKTMNYSFAVRRSDAELYLIISKTSGFVSRTSIESALLTYSWPEAHFSLMEFLSEHLLLVIVSIVGVSILLVLLLMRRAHRIRLELENRMKLHETLSAALANAEAANKAKTSFLSNMSHEIRTPMNAIIGLDSMALRDETLSPQTRDYLQKIGASARHLLTLINDILDMSRIESGRLVLRREEFSFSAMLEQINTMVISQCNDKGLTYECRILNHVDDSYIGDEMKLKQVLINILSNAIKFTNAPGSVTLSVEQTAEFDNQSTLRFRIKDTGIGMDQDYIPKLFDAFSQEDGSRTTKYGSTGLGMAITKSIVEMMNGTIRVESEKGVGTEFIVTVTLKQSDRIVSHEENMIDPHAMRVLVVDDDELAAEHARMVLEEVGIRADTCTGGAEALRMMEVQHTKHEPYNLVLMDWSMPEMNGLEASEKIREKFNSESTVVVLTAYNWDDIREDAQRAGVDSFLPKPLFASNIIEEFNRIARRNNLNLLQKKKQAELAGRRVLLAEDVEINAEIMLDILSMEEIEADHAENGKIAVEMFEKSAAGAYSAILMDVRMPEMDGLEAAAAIRAMDREDAKQIPIIALTANAFDEDVQRSLQAGMNVHLTKPVDPDNLFQTLGELIYEAENQSS